MEVVSLVHLPYSSVFHVHGVALVSHRSARIHGAILPSIFLVVLVGDDRVVLWCRNPSGKQADSTPRGVSGGGANTGYL